MSARPAATSGNPAEGLPPPHPSLAGGREGFMALRQYSGLRAVAKWQMAITDVHDLIVAFRWGVNGLTETPTAFLNHEHPF